MGKAHGISGGGIEGRQTAHYRDPKVEPKPHAVSVGAVSRLGGMVGEGTPHKAFYNAQGYTTPSGPTSNLDCRPGGNGRQILPSGSQSRTPSPTPMSGPRRSLFK
jgi:hypothetical protein